MKNFEINDRVIITKSFLNRGIYGTIVDKIYYSKNYGSLYSVQLDNYHKGDIRSFFPFEMEPVGYFEKIKLEHMDIDPYGEENWI